MQHPNGEQVSGLLGGERHELADERMNVLLRPAGNLGSGYVEAVLLEVDGELTSRRRPCGSLLVVELDQLTHL